MQPFACPKTDKPVLGSLPGDTGIMMRLEFWPDYGSGPVWSDEGKALALESLGISPVLAERVRLWKRPPLFSNPSGKGSAGKFSRLDGMVRFVAKLA